MLKIFNSPSPIIQQVSVLQRGHVHGPTQRVHLPTRRIPHRKHIKHPTLTSIHERQRNGTLVPHIASTKTGRVICLPLPTYFLGLPRHRLQKWSLLRFPSTVKDSTLPEKKLNPGLGPSKGYIRPNSKGQRGWRTHSASGRPKLSTE